MKITLFSLALVAGGLNAQAQSSQYQAALTQNLAVLDTVSRSAGFKKLTGNFERIAAAEKTQWLPYYYASYCAIRTARLERDLNKLDATLDKAESLAQSANALSPQNSEVYCLNALIAYTRINVDFMARGPKFSGIANEALTTAQQLDPANPRPYLLIGQSKYSTPEQFGGDKKLACQYFEKANALFATAPASPINPRWGKADAARYLGLCKQPATATAKK
jgi:hypothetical protein